MSSVLAVPALAEQVQALQELDRRECFADPLVFMRRHVSIEEPDGQVIPLELWGFQEDAVRALHDDRAVVVLKARRLGLSWIYLAYALWLAITQQGIRVLILCKTGDDAAELLDRIRRMRDRIAEDRASAHLLAGLGTPAKVRDAVQTLDVGSSTIKALMGTPAAARSETAGLVLLDEFAFQRGAPDIWRAILPTIEGGGRLAAISTGNGPGTSVGIGAEFARQYGAAASGSSELRALFFAWMVRPDRDEAWKVRTVALLGSPERFRTEYPESPSDAFTVTDATMVYPSEGIDAAERLGHLLDKDPPAPAGEFVHLGIDWGEQTHGLIVWPLESGGVYVAPGEVRASSLEPGASARRMLDAAARIPHRLGEARFDAAGVQSMRTFLEVAGDGQEWLSVPFSKHKTATVDYLRLLFRRTAAGEKVGVIAISPSNVVLLRQLRGLLLADDDSGKVAKGDDHGPDALIAGVAPIAARHRNLMTVEG